jgi:MFS transporter, DHA1 family, inner membrane transport protein
LQNLPFVNPLTRSIRFQILVFILTRLVFNTLHRMVYPFLPFFVRGLGVDLAQISAAMSIRSAAGALSPFLAVVADMRGRKSAMLLGVAFFVAGVGLVAFHPVYWTFLMAMVLATIGYLVFIPSMQAYLGDQISYERRGLPLALTELSWSLSFIVGIPLVGLMIARLGWTSLFPLFAVFGILALLSLGYWLPADTQAVRAQTNLWAKFKIVFTSSLAVTGLLMGISFTMANEVVNLVFAVWMENAFGFKLAALGLVAFTIGLAEFTGEVLVGGFVDRLGKVRSVAIGLLANCAAALMLAMLGRSLVGAIACLALFYLTFEFTIVSSLPLMSEILPETRATLLAANIALISIGRSIGAWLAPRIFDMGNSQSILPNALSAIALNLFALLALLFLRKVEKK